MSKKIPKDVRELSLELKSDFRKLLTLSHVEIRQSALGAFSAGLVETILGWYRDSNPDIKVSIPVVMDHLGEVFDVPECVAHEFRHLGIETRGTAPEDFSILEIYQVVQRVNEKAPEVAREIRKSEAARRLRYPFFRWPFEGRGESVRLEITDRPSESNPPWGFALIAGSFRGAQIFLEDIAALLDQDPDFVRPLRSGQTVELPGVVAEVMKSKFRIEFDRKAFDGLCEACGVANANVA